MVDRGVNTRLGGGKLHELKPFVLFPQSAAITDCRTTLSPEGVLPTHICYKNQAVKQNKIEFEIEVHNPACMVILNCKPDHCARALPHSCNECVHIVPNRNQMRMFPCGRTAMHLEPYLHMAFVLQYPGGSFSGNTLSGSGVRPDRCTS